MQLNNLQQQTQVTKSLVRKVGEHTFRKEGNRWVDEAFKKDMKTITVKALSDAYFDLLSNHPELREVFQLGEQVTVVTREGTALVIVNDSGKEQLTQADLSELFGDSN